LSNKDTKTEVAQTTPTKAVESAIEDTIDAPAEQEGGIGALEEEAGQQGAFNPETGEINWDCPCLGGMAHGPW
jgi:intermembrane space import and assembly protein 40